jgi:hypothetical protein
MRTSINGKSGGKKSLAIKWRDREWLPRIVIRSNLRRLTARAFRGESIGGPCSFRFARLGANGRAREGISSPRKLNAPAPVWLPRSRFSNASRSDNSL